MKTKFKKTTMLSIYRDKILFHLYHNNVNQLLYYYDLYIENGGNKNDIKY